MSKSALERVNSVPLASKSRSGYSSTLTQFKLYSERLLLLLIVAIVESITSKVISSVSIFLIISTNNLALIKTEPSL